MILCLPCWVIAEGMKCDSYENPIYVSWLNLVHWNADTEVMHSDLMVI